MKNQPALMVQLLHPGRFLWCGATSHQPSQREQHTKCFCMKPCLHFTIFHPILPASLNKTIWPVLSNSGLQMHQAVIIHITKPSFNQRHQHPSPGTEHIAFVETGFDAPESLPPHTPRTLTKEQSSPAGRQALGRAPVSGFEGRGKSCQVAQATVLQGEGMGERRQDGQRWEQAGTTAPRGGRRGGASSPAAMIKQSPE